MYKLFTLAIAVAITPLSQKNTHMWISVAAANRKRNTFSQLALSLFHVPQSGVCVAATREKGERERELCCLRVCVRGWMSFSV